jgi:exopolysaccharide biosynthesis polyprenyl glycosylphosphotransferase
MFGMSSFAATWVALHFWSSFTVERVAVTAAVTILAWLYLFSRVGLYHRSFALSIKDEFYYTVTALCLGVAPLLVIFTLVPAIASSRVVILLSLVFSILTVGSTRAVAHMIRDANTRRHPRRIVIFGTEPDVESARDGLNLPEDSTVFTGRTPDMEGALDSVDIPGGLDATRWYRDLKANQCTTMIFTEMPSPRILPYLLECASRDNIKVAIAPPRMQALSYELTLETEGHQALVVPSKLRACQPPARLMKRLTDLAVASFALVLFAPLMVLIAFAVYLDSGAPVLYRQERVGRDGKSFEILKFRSMRVDAESQSGPIWTSAGDPRRTRIGSFLRRTSLDELPQLFNVIRGDMSVVGPRPERPVFARQFREHLARYDERHLVRPGITGLSHVTMQRNVDSSRIAERLSYDLFYIEHWGLLMDFSILFKTAAEIAFHRAS